MCDTAEHLGGDHSVYRAIGHGRHRLAALRHKADLRVQVRGLMQTLASEEGLECLVRVDAVQTGAGRVELQVGAGAHADLTEQSVRGAMFVWG